MQRPSRGTNLFQRSKSSNSLKRHSSIPTLRGSSLTRQNSSDKIVLTRQNSATKLTSVTKAKKLSICTPASIRHYSSISGSSSAQRSSILGARSSVLSGSATRTKSPKKVLDDRPLNDIQWQRVNTSLVKEYLMETNTPHLANFVKPDLTIGLFVDITQVLLMMLDPRIKLSNVNYIVEVPAFLKTIGYPGVCTASLMKTVNVKRSWSQVLAIWAWLVEKLNILNSFTPENIFSSNEDVIVFKLLCKAFKLTDDQCKDENQELSKAILQEFEDGLRSAMVIQEISVDLEDVYKKNAAEEKEVKQKQQILDKLKVNIWEIDENIKANQKSIDEKRQTLLRKIEESKQIEEGYKKVISTKTHTINGLKNSLGNQKYSVQQRKDLNTKLLQAKHLLTLKEERKKEQMKEYDLCEMKFNETTKKIRTELFNINNKNTMLGRNYEEMKKLVIPEENINHPNFMQMLKDNKKKSESITEELKRNTKHIIDSKETEIYNVEKGIKEECTYKEEQLNAAIIILEDTDSKYLSEQAKYNDEMEKLILHKHEIEKNLHEIKNKAEKQLEEEEQSECLLESNIERLKQVSEENVQIINNFEQLRNFHYQGIKETKLFLLETWKKYNAKMDIINNLNS